MSCSIDFSDALRSMVLNKKKPSHSPLWRRGPMESAAVELVVGIDLEGNFRLFHISTV